MCFVSEVLNKIYWYILALAVFFFFSKLHRLEYK